MLLRPQRDQLMCLPVEQESIVRQRLEAQIRLEIKRARFAV